MTEIKWIGPQTFSTSRGELKYGVMVNVPEEVAAKWISQGFAELPHMPEPATVVISWAKESKSKRKVKEA
jgi:hypothetical protein